MSYFMSDWLRVKWEKVVPSGVNVAWSTQAQSETAEEWTLQSQTPAKGLKVFSRVLLMLKEALNLAKPLY